MKIFTTAALFYNFQNVFQKFDSKGATKIDFNTFQFGKNLDYSLALETRTVNNNPIISSTSLQPLLLGAEKILRHVARWETSPKERASFTYSTN